MTKTLLAGIAVLAVSVSAARADQPIGPYEVYDSNGNLIGQIASAYAVIATINGKVYQLDNIQRNEGSSFAYMFPNADFWYSNTTCSGQRYFLDYGEFPPRAYYESSGSPGSKGQTLWTYSTSTQPQTLTVGSYWYAYGGYCQPYSATFNYNVVPAVSLESTTKGFSPPFCISNNGPRCVGKKD